jgi:tRNA pseudouridine38-40 synthase
MFRYKITLAYDGTHYSGWQVQPNSTSIQFLVQKALSTALGETIGVTGSGRTDAGVHALGQTCHFTCADKVDTYRLLASLNGLLPKDIRICSIEEVHSDFHARYSAKSKIYHYHLHLNPVMDPAKRLYATHYPYNLDLSKIEEGAKHLVGTHNFLSFANENDRGSASRKPVKTMKRLDLVPEAGGIRLEFEADGFLYKMVRNIVGTLLDVGRGKLKSSSLPEILASQDRKRASAAAPPQGLFLVQVLY